jgi:hypothetical protein
VERAEGADIGLDRRFAYYRFKQQPTRQDHLKIAAEAVAEFNRVA